MYRANKRFDYLNGVSPIYVAKHVFNFTHLRATLQNLETQSIKIIL